MITLRQYFEMKFSTFPSQSQKVGYQLFYISAELHNIVGINTIEASKDQPGVFRKSNRFHLQDHHQRLGPGRLGTETHWNKQSLLRLGKIHGRPQEETNGDAQ